VHAIGIQRVRGISGKGAGFTDGSLGTASAVQSHRRVRICGKKKRQRKRSRHMGTGEEGGEKKNSDTGEKSGGEAEKMRIQSSCQAIAGLVEDSPSYKLSVPS